MNGKGSARRGTSREEQKRYQEGWDRIFGKPKKTTKKKEPRGPARPS